MITRHIIRHHTYSNYIDKQLHLQHAECSWQVLPKVFLSRQNRQPAASHHAVFKKSIIGPNVSNQSISMKLSVLTATVIFLAYASVGEAQLKCPVSTVTPPCALTLMPSNYVCYSCAYTGPPAGTFSGGCDNSVTTGIASCTATKTQIQGLYPGCTW